MYDERDPEHNAPAGDPGVSPPGGEQAFAAQELLPAVYGELRRLAHARMRQIPPGQTLDPTALVHEAWVRISDRRPDGWSGRAEFFHAAARAMRDILVEDARRKGSIKRGGGRKRLVFSEQDAITIETPSDEVLALDESIAALADAPPDAARVVSLRYFTGLTIQEVAEIEGVSVSTVERSWRFARAWLRDHLGTDSTPNGGGGSQDG